MIPFKNSGFQWYSHFQITWPGARARGRHAVVGGRQTAPAVVMDSPSTPTSASTPLDSNPLSNTGMDVDAAAATSVKCKNDGGSNSGSERQDSPGTSILVSSTIVASDTSRSNKAAKTSTTSTAHSSSTSARPKPASLIATSSRLSVAESQMPLASSTKSTGWPIRLNRTDALAEQLRGAIASLTDTMCGTTEDPITATHHTATDMINADPTLTNGRRIHILQCFIDNVAYSEVYIAMLDKPKLKKKFYQRLLKG